MTIHEDIIAAYEPLIFPGLEKVHITERYYSSYGDPHTNDFEELASIEWDGEPWQFNMTAIFHHKPSGALFYATDSGCSCPSPFEGTTTEHLVPLTRTQDWLEHVEKNIGQLRRDEEDIRLGRLEDPNYRPWYDLSDMQRQLSYVTDQSFHVFNTISDHFETHDIVVDFSVSLVEVKEDEDDDVV